VAVRRFKDLVCWQLARELERRVHAFTDKPAARKDLDFCKQIRRSSSSAPRNMVEGFARFWPAEFAHKLRIAIGELEETQDHLEKAFDSKYILKDEFDEMFRLADRSIGASVKFVGYLETSGEHWKNGFRAARRQRRPGPRGEKDLEGNAEPEREP
jgi:four helix bundle protein